jgi:hypothetical protein
MPRTACPTEDLPPEIKVVIRTAIAMQTSETLGSHCATGEELGTVWGDRQIRGSFSARKGDQAIPMSLK